MGIITVLWEKWVEFRRDFYKITMAAMISPLMSFGAVAQNMSVQRLYEKALDQVMVSPTPLWQFITGQILGGALRGMYAGIVILLLTLPVQNGLIFNGWSFLIMFLNGMVFSTIALVLSFLSKSYADTPRYNAYIITPMSFLCNTFFSTDQMPGVFRRIVGALPLSQTSGMIRAISHGEDPGTTGFIVLLLYLVVFSLIAMVYIYRKKTL